jgi:hypothetical protein
VVVAVVQTVAPLPVSVHVPEPIVNALVLALLELKNPQVTFRLFTPSTAVKVPAVTVNILPEFMIRSSPSLTVPVPLIVMPLFDTPLDVRVAVVEVFIVITDVASVTVIPVPIVTFPPTVAE